MATKVKVKKGDTLNALAQKAGYKNYKEAGATGFKSGNPDRIYEGEEISFGGSPAVGSTGGVPNAGTNLDLGKEEKKFNLKDSGIGDFSVSETEDQALEELISNSRKGSLREINESDIRNKNLGLFQAQIDSVNQIYDSLVAGEKIQGEGRLGSGRAIANRGGLIGSARGETQKQNIVARNSEIMNTIQAERSFKINQILGLAQKQSLEEIQAERAAKRQSASDYLGYLTVQDERREKNVKTALASMISQGFSLEDLQPDEFEQLSKDLRVSGDTLRTTFESLKPEPKKSEYFNLGEGQARYVIDPETGEAKLVASRAKTYAPKSGSGSGGSGDYGSGYDDETVDVLSFDEFKATPEAQALLKAEEDRTKSNFADRGEAFLKSVYDQQVKELEGATKRTASTGSGSLGNLTTAKKAILQQGGLTSGAGNAQSYYLNTPTQFQQYYARGVASGSFKPNASIEDVDKVYSEWYAKENDGESGGGDVFDF